VVALLRHSRIADGLPLLVEERSCSGHTTMTLDLESDKEGMEIPQCSGLLPHRVWGDALAARFA
jgi:hypothetical protein